MKRSFNCGSGDATIWLEKASGKHVGTLSIQINTGKNNSAKDLKKLMFRLSTWLTNAAVKIP